MVNNTLVLGASSDIGCEVLHAIDKSDCRHLAHYSVGGDKLGTLDLEGELVLLQADLSVAEGCETLIATVEEMGILPDGIVYLPSFRPQVVRFKSTGWAAFQKHLDLQVAGAFRILHHFLPRMAKRRSGKVVFVLSIYTQGVPPKAMAPYVTAKYAQLGLMKALAAEYSDKGLCINGVSPSMVETAFLSEIPEKIVEFSAQKHPRGRNATPADIAPAVAFLLSDEAGYITGVSLPVAGGLEF